MHLTDLQLMYLFQESNSRTSKIAGVSTVQEFWRNHQNNKGNYSMALA